MQSIKKIMNFVPVAFSRQNEHPVKVLQINEYIPAKVSIVNYFNRKPIQTTKIADSKDKYSCHPVKLSDPSLEGFYLKNYGPKRVYLTRQEIRCATYIAKGYTIKETAKFLKLSPRTVESYLNGAKIKLDAKNMVHLIFLLTRTLDLG